ncbi:MAG: hypothetical protein FD135_4800 [Comamonadaceae bacterium]|nr:MAG: hypothetical protein FD135_4800 [Comamonadaceae bacterium]
MTQSTTSMFQELTGLFEPSAVEQLPDGRFLVVEDEKQHPLSLVAINAAGVVTRKALSPGLFESGDDFWKLDDLEGLTIDQSGHLYALTSHSLDGDGHEKKSRARLVRFRIEGNRVVEPKVVSGLKRALTATHPVLATAAEIQDVKVGGGLNIEALQMSPDQQRLLIGFRSPLMGHKAIIASVENPDAIFETDKRPEVSATLMTLDLDGNGIRGMSYIPALAGYLIISGPVSREPDRFGLWFWSGGSDGSVQRVTVPGLENLNHAEGVCSALMDGKQKIVIVCDDGSRKEQRYARFILLEPAQLHIAP